MGELATEVVYLGLLDMMMNATADLFQQTCFNYPTLGDLYKYATYDPAWSSIPPTRILHIVAEADAKDTSNGERLRKAIESLVPGDQLEVGAGTYSVDRLWDMAISGTAEAPLWIVAAKGAKVIFTRPDAKQNILNVGQSHPMQHVVFRGLEFTGGSHGIRLGKCNNVWIDRCHIHHTHEVCLSANSADTHHLYLTRNTIHDGGGTAEGMYLGGNNGHVIMSESVITIAGNVVLGEGVKHSSHLGRGLVDFKELAWDATKHDATPSHDAPFDRGVEAYRPPVDLTGNPRKQTSVTSGAITR